MHAQLLAQSVTHASSYPAPEQQTHNSISSFLFTTLAQVAKSPLHLSNQFQVESWMLFVRLAEKFYPS